MKIMKEKTQSSTRTHKIIYWVATLWLALGMVSTAVVQIMQIPEVVDEMTALGYPMYIFPFLGIVKIAGVIALLVPKFTLLKEWAYAGFLFLMLGALYSHTAAGDPLIESFGPALLLVLCMLSWYFRPANRRLQSVQISGS